MSCAAGTSVPTTPVPTTNDERPTTGSVPTTNDERPTTGPVPTTNDQQPTTGPVPTTNDQQPTTGFVPTTGSDELWMEEALRAAQRALEAGEVPVGAVVVSEGRIIGRGWNRNISDNDPTAHAEIIALREAGAAIGNHRLSECDLFATIEPCPMCAGAMVHARIKRLIYGADDPKAGAVNSVMKLLNHKQLNHKPEVRSGVLAGRCAELLQTFFKNRR
jgi:tRNA(adenine34) deaminase